MVEQLIERNRAAVRANELSGRSLAMSENWHHSCMASLANHSFRDIFTLTSACLHVNKVAAAVPALF
jgi:hypothetical protein